LIFDELVEKPILGPQHQWFAAGFISSLRLILASL